MATKDEDTVEQIFSARSLDHLLFFTDQGKVYAQRAYMIPEARREGKGTLINAFLALQPEEYVTAVASVPTFENTTGYFVLCTRGGRIKRVPVRSFAAVRSNGLIAMALDHGDYLGWVKHTSGSQDLVVVTRLGQSIRFNEKDVRVMGRTAGGVSAMRLRGDDEITALDVIDDLNNTLLVVTENGYGKRTPLREYKLQRRYGSGIRTLSKDMKKTGPIIGASVVSPDDGLTLITSGGIALRTEVDTISVYGRSTSGVKVIDLADDDGLVSIAIVSSEKRSQAAADRLKGDGASGGNGSMTEEELMILEDELLTDEEIADEEDLIEETELVDEDEVLDEDEIEALDDDDENGDLDDDDEPLGNGFADY
jgi:DNA gyrase subunit A